jgi:hypothetical protein
LRELEAERIGEEMNISLAGHDKKMIPITN